MTNTKENPAHGWHHGRGARKRLGSLRPLVTCSIPQIKAKGKEVFSWPKESLLV